MKIIRESTGQSLKKWHQNNPTVLAIGLASLTLVLLAVLCAAIPGLPALRTLFILPIWMSARIAGRVSGFIVVAFASTANVWLDALEEFKAPAAVASGLIWFLVFSVVMLLVAQIEDAIRQQERLALHDPLTGLLNRRGLEYQGERYFSVARTRAVLAMLDCDRFKRINDEFGHHAGDEALRALSRILLASTRESDVVARLGGDEFVVILAQSSEAEAKAVMSRVAAAFELEMDRAGFDVSLSYGIASKENEKDDLRDVVARADEDMYIRKGAKQMQRQVS